MTIIPAGSKAKDNRPKKRAKTPTMLQMEAAECGAASLGMVLGYHGRMTSLDTLRVECGVSRDGIKASNLVKAARRFGLIAKGFKKEPEDLRRISPPMIVHWNFNHFLVVEGFKGDRVYLNDPAFGPRIVSSEEFDQAFTGVVLVFEPGPDFKKGGERHSWVAALRRRLSGARLALSYIVLTGLLLVVPGLVVPIFLQIFVDNILIGGSQRWMVPLLIGMGLTVAINALLTWLREYYLLRLETRLALSQAGKFLWHVLRLPIEFFNQRYAGEIGARVSLNDEVARLLAGELANTLVSIVTVIFYALVMFFYDPLLTLIGIFIVILNMVALQYFSRKRRDGSHRLLQERGKLTGVSMSGLLTLETLKASGTESDFFERWAGHHAKTINAQQALTRDTLLLSNVPVFLAGLNTAVILGVGGLQVMTGGLSIGALVAFQSLMASFTAPFHDLVNFGGQIQEIEGDLNRLDDVLRHEVQVRPVQEEPESAEIDGVVRLSGSIALKNLTFGYNPLAPPLIEDFCLTLKPGSRVALVGGSGSGKSTAAKLLAGLYAPWEGEILFDGRPRSAWPRRLITNSLAMVDQEIFLFRGTVRENLTLWNPLTPEANMVSAAKDAQIHEVVAARPGGYDSRVDEGGRNFSGGQRQRLEIARALTGRPTMLILDEATSALDAETEKIIDENIRRRGCTCLIVAHRLSTIRDCDEIIVLEAGKIVQRGTHDRLSEVEGPYAHLVQVELT